jgi:hypothetical protein
MTTEEQKNVIGGVVLEYGEVKQKMAALDEDLRGKMATVFSVEKAFNMNDREKMLALLDSWPSADYFKSTLTKLAEMKKRKAELEQTMKQYGIDL